MMARTPKIAAPDAREGPSTSADGSPVRANRPVRNICAESHVKPSRLCSKKAASASSWSPHLSRKQGHRTVHVT